MSTGFVGGQSELVAELASTCRSSESIDAIAAVARSLGGLTDPFGISISEDYPYPSVDVVFPGEEPSRVFIHTAFPGDKNRTGEEVLEAAELGYFPVFGYNQQFNFREIPPTTIPLRSHNLSSSMAERVSSRFLAPTLRKLFVARGVVPTAVTMNNLVHVEHVRHQENSDVLTVGVAFIPPYEFVFVDPQSFVATAIVNTDAYGRRVQDRLKFDLQENNSV